MRTATILVAATAVAVVAGGPEVQAAQILAEERAAALAPTPTASLHPPFHALLELHVPNIEGTMNVNDHPLEKRLIPPFWPPGGGGGGDSSSSTSTTSTTPAPTSSTSPSTTATTPQSSTHVLPTTPAPTSTPNTASAVSASQASVSSASAASVASVASASEASASMVSASSAAAASSESAEQSSLSASSAAEQSASSVASASAASVSSVSAASVASASATPAESTLSSSSSSSSSSTSPSASTSSKAATNHTGAIVGGAVGGGLGALLLILLALWAFCRRRKLPDNESDVRWAEMEGSQNLSSRPTHRTGGAGFDMGDNSDPEERGAMASSPHHRGHYRGASNGSGAAGPARSFRYSRPQSSWEQTDKFGPVSSGTEDAYLSPPIPHYPSPLSPALSGTASLQGAQAPSSIVSGGYGAAGIGAGGAGIVPSYYPNDPNHGTGTAAYGPVYPNNYGPSITTAQQQQQQSSAYQTRFMNPLYTAEDSHGFMDPYGRATSPPLVLNRNLRPSGSMGRRGR